MNHLKFRFPVFLLLVICLTSTSCVTKYYLVRHAERLDNSANSPLSTAGFARAIVLCDTLRDKGIDSIFATNFIRTQQTAQPTSNLLNEPIQIVNAQQTNDLISALKAIRGKDVLVVGHSNTIPVIVEALSGTSVSLSEDEFDRLFVVTVRRRLSGTTRMLLQLNYGVPTP
jgi:broad specificity phosphatase PhoE